MKEGNLKRILALLLSFIMVIGILPQSIPSAKAMKYIPTVWDGTANTDWYTSDPSQTNYYITTADQLVGLASLVNDGTTTFSGITITLTADILLNDTTDWENWNANTSGLHSWTPIGTNTTRTFSGIFDGNGHTISGIYISAANKAFQGLFGHASNSTIQNISVINSYIYGNYYLGGIVGYSYKTTIDNCGNSGTVIGEYMYIGGIVGIDSTTANTTIIQNCNNSGKISSNYLNGYAYVGGIAGCSKNLLQNCYNTGTVTANADRIGGIVGSNGGTTQYCYNIGNVIGNSSTGGIVGSDLDSNTATTKHCYNAGAISGGKYNVGGIVGYYKGTSSVEYCYNSGNVIGTGAIAGYTPTNYLKYCYYDKQICPDIGGRDGNDYTGKVEGKLTSEMTSGIPFDNWSSISGEINIWNITEGMYPRLTGYLDAGTDYIMDETDAAIVSATPIFLHENTDTDYETTRSVYTDFNVSIKNAVYWTISDVNVIDWDLTKTTSAEMKAIVTGKGKANLTAKISENGPSKTIFVIVPSNNADLDTIFLKQDSAPAGVDGTSAENAITWAIDVGFLTESISQSDIVASHSEASVRIYNNAEFSSLVEESLALSVDTPTIAYIKIRAEDNKTYKYYAVTITRMKSVNYDTSWYSAKENSFTLTNEKQLRGFSAIVNGTAYPTDADGNVTDTSTGISADSFTEKSVTLANDITLSEEKWTPIGKYRNFFQGTFDGAQHTVSGMNITSATRDEPEVGLFGFCNKATIKNLTVKGAFVYTLTNHSSLVGGIAGITQDSVLLNCNAQVTMDIDGLYVYAGGLVGANVNSTILNCGTKVDININGGGSIVGGIAGTSSSEFLKCIYNSFAQGTINISLDAENGNNSGYTGGIAGVIFDDNAVNNYFVGTITTTNSEKGKIGDAFGLISLSEGMTISNNFYDSSKNGVGEVMHENFNDIYNISADACVTGISAEDMKKSDGLLASLNAGREAVNALLAAEGSSLKADEWYILSDVNNGYPQFEAVSSSESSSSEGSSSHSSSSRSSTTNTNNVPVTVDGKSYNIGVATTKTDASTGEKTTVVTVDVDSFNQKLAQARESVVISVPNVENVASSQSVLTAKMVDNAAKKEMTVAVKTNDISYVIPAVAVDVNAAAKVLGVSSDNLDDVEVEINITKLSDDSANFVKNAAEKGGYTLMMSPVEFSINAIANGKSIEISKFNNYVERNIAIPSAVNPNKITTAVVITADGTERHVPTEVYQAEDGEYYARIHSLTNSVYALIDHDVSFMDTKGTWYEGVASELASRMIFNGRDTNTFDGTAKITRAEFVATLIRALGLPEDGSCNFKDVNKSAWYYGAVGKASSYGLISGYADGSFAPNAKISRQEAMVILQRAAVIADYVGQGSNDTMALTGFTDTEIISKWAQKAVEFNVSNGLIVGNNGTLRPKDSITRAECAVAVLRFLQNAKLVDIRLSV